jgi:site-specific DNA-methyltransferase (adenine-specific)
MFNEGEMAFVSIGRSVMVDIWWNGVGVIHSKEYRFHPTQKPVALYQWLLTNYAKRGQKILDTHLGSGSSAIAAHYFGVDFVGCELDKDYFEAAKARFDMATKQLAMSI